MLFRKKKPELTEQQKKALEKARQEAYFLEELEKAKKQGKDDSKGLLEKLGGLGNFDFSVVNEKADQMTHFLAGDTFSEKKEKKSEKWVS